MTNDRSILHQRPTRSRGAVYVLALIVTMILTMLGLTSLSLVACKIQSASLAEDVLQARTLAQAGADLAAHRLSITPNWRTLYATDPIIDAAALGPALVTVTITASDPLPGTPVTVISEATVGQAVQYVQSILVPTPVPLKALSSSLHAQGSIQFSAANVFADSIISSNSSIDATASEIEADVEASGAIQGTTYFGTTTAGLQVRSVPTSSMIDDLAAEAVAIPFASLPSGTIEQTLLSPNTQPFTGETHSRGLYVIDCQGADITIRDSRILGTLILQNPGAGSAIENAVLMQAADPILPVLLVQGSITIRLTRAALDETDAGANFNPPADPYRGQSDSTIDDRYPSGINGLTYITDTLFAYKRSVFSGSVLAGDLDCQGTLVLRHDPTLAQSPPAGFVEKYVFSPSPGSWQRIVK